MKIGPITIINSADIEITQQNLQDLFTIAFATPAINQLIEEISEHSQIEVTFVESDQANRAVSYFERTLILLDKEEADAYNILGNFTRLLFEALNQNTVNFINFTDSTDYVNTYLSFEYEQHFMPAIKLMIQLLQDPAFRAALERTGFFDASNCDYEVGRLQNLRDQNLTAAAFIKNESISSTFNQPSRAEELFAKHHQYQQNYNKLPEHLFSNQKPSIANTRGYPLAQALIDNDLEAAKSFLAYPNKVILDRLSTIKHDAGTLKYTDFEKLINDFQNLHYKLFIDIQEQRISDDDLRKVLHNPHYNLHAVALLDDFVLQASTTGGNTLQEVAIKAGYEGFEVVLHLLEEAPVCKAINDQNLNALQKSLCFPKVVDLLLINLAYQHSLRFSRNKTSCEITAYLEQIKTKYTNLFAAIQGKNGALKNEAAIISYVNNMLIKDAININFQSGEKSLVTLAQAAGYYKLANQLECFKQPSDLQPCLAGLQNLSQIRAFLAANATARSSTSSAVAPSPIAKKAAASFKLSLSTGPNTRLLTPKRVSTAAPAFLLSAQGAKLIKDKDGRVVATQNIIQKKIKTTTKLIT